MKAIELRQKNPTELEAELRELYREQFNLRMQQDTSGKTGRLSFVRRDIARVKTLLREKVNK